MSRDTKVYIQDILESITAIEEYAKGLTQPAFEGDRQVQDAIVRRFEIIGEAVKNIDNDFRSKYPSVPWREIAGMRDVLLHEYFGINMHRVWGAIRKDIPHLKKEILNILQS